jgi:DNA end-binding protein Ku
MTGRTSWKGYLGLSLVSCPVHLTPATSGSERTSFHFLNPKTHNRVQMRAHDAESGQEIPRDQLVRGRYVVVTDDDLAAIQMESSRTIDLMRFVEAAAVDPVYRNAPYFVAPEGRIGEETFRVVHRAMRQSGKAGIGRVVLSTREHPVLLEPHERGMLLTTLRPADEVRAAAPAFADIGDGPLDKAMIELAVRIIEQKAGPFDPRELAGDRYQAALRQMVERKITGQKPAAAKTRPASGNVVNLMDALKRSLEADQAKRPAASKRRAAAKTGKPAPAKPRRKAR